MFFIFFPQFLGWACIIFSRKFQVHSLNFKPHSSLYHHQNEIIHLFITIIINFGRYKVLILTCMGNWELILRLLYPSVKTFFGSTLSKQISCLFIILNNNISCYIIIFITSSQTACKLGKFPEKESVLLFFQVLYHTLILSFSCQQ